MQTSAISNQQKSFHALIRWIAVAILICALVLAGLWGTRNSAAAQENEEPGVLIVRVLPGSPAAEAGLRRGTILLRVDGEAVNSLPELMAALAEKEAGDEVELTYLHGDDERTATVTMGEADGRALLGIVPFPGDGRMQFRFEGIPFGEGANPPMFHFFASEGAMIVDIVEDSAAAEAGLEEGDIILAVDGETVVDGAALVELISGYAPGDTITLDVRTGEEARTVEVTLGAREDDADLAFLGVQVGGPSSFERMDPESMPFRFEMPAPHGAVQPLQGVLIREVAEDSPAAEAGLAMGDLILEVDGAAVATFEDLREIILSAAPGDELTLTVRTLGAGMRMFRGDAQPTNDEPRTVTVTLGENEEGNAFLGISATPLRLRMQEGMPRNFTLPRPDAEDDQSMIPGRLFRGMPALRERVERFFHEMPNWGSGRGIEMRPLPAQPAQPSTEL
ncbi:MAG: PDZ domain-containing protein [Caldilineaceae bacterium]|nr:PDZ domain-containing protein [Caldilineaceae bacterium]